MAYHDMCHAINGTCRRLLEKQMSQENWACLITPINAKFPTLKRFFQFWFHGTSWHVPLLAHGDDWHENWWHRRTGPSGFPTPSRDFQMWNWMDSEIWIMRVIIKNRELRNVPCAINGLLVRVVKKCLLLAPMPHRTTPDRNLPDCRSLLFDGDRNVTALVY